MIQLGPYTQHEIPEPFTLTITDAAGSPVWDDPDGWDGWFAIRRPDGTTATTGATVDTDGRVTHQWTGTDLSTPGVHGGEFWVSNGTNRFASGPVTFYVRAALVDPSSLGGS
jgi:hypothetical protein